MLKKVKTNSLLCLGLFFFLCNPADKSTNQTDNGENITCLPEVMTKHQQRQRAGIVGSVDLWCLQRF